MTYELALDKLLQVTAEYCSDVHTPLVHIGNYLPEFQKERWNFT
jgi:hypothetical protein